MNQMIDVNWFESIEVINMIVYEAMKEEFRRENCIQFHPISCSTQRNKYRVCTCHELTIYRVLLCQATQDQKYRFQPSRNLLNFENLAVHISPRMCADKYTINKKEYPHF